MTKIKYDITGPEFYLSAEGHAGYDEPGKDIICAGVSSVTMALLNILLNDETHDKAEAETKFKLDVKNGQVMIRSSPILAAKFDRLKVRAYFKMAVIGLQALADEYPEHITIEEVKNNGGD